MVYRNSFLTICRFSLTWKIDCSHAPMHLSILMMLLGSIHFSLNSFFPSLLFFLPLSSGVKSCVTPQAEVHLLWMNSLRLRCEAQQDCFRRASVCLCPRCFSWLMNDLTFARLRSLAGARLSVHRWTSHSHLTQTASFLSIIVSLLAPAFW